MQKLELEFLIEKETKGALRYQEVVKDGGDAKIGSFYVRKSAIVGEVPKRIKVVIDEA